MMVLVGAPIENAPSGVIPVERIILTTEARCYVAIVRCLETLTQWVHTIRSALSSIVFCLNKLIYGSDILE